MAGLMGSTEKKQALRKAGDAERDPASISASENDSGENFDNTGDTDVGHEIDKTSGNEDDKHSGMASTVASDSTVRKVSETASGQGSRKASGKAGRSAGAAASRKSRSKASGRPRRGAGRPAGPERRPITVRVLAEHDARLTEAWDSHGLRPQTVIDQALGEWFERHLDNE